MKVKLAVLTVAFLSLGLVSNSEARVEKCRTEGKHQGGSLGSYTDFMRENRIILKAGEVQASDLEEYIEWYEKIPESLRAEVIQKGGKTHLIHGHGVTEDPTWGAHVETHDGRSWSAVPGAGGAPYAGSPTRIVVNRLYEGHGSVSLVLHEQGHTIDSTFKDAGVSASTTWKELIEKNAGATRLLEQICRSYCTSSLRESFAELFAYYHSCEASRAHLEEEAPGVADFFRELVSTKELSRMPRVALAEPKPKPRPREDNTPTTRPDVRPDNRPEPQTFPQETKPQPRPENGGEVDTETQQSTPTGPSQFEEGLRKAGDWLKVNVPKAGNWLKENVPKAARVVVGKVTEGFNWVRGKIGR